MTRVTEVAKSGESKIVDCGVIYSDNSGPEWAVEVSSNLRGVLEVEVGEMFDCLCEADRCHLVWRKVVDEEDVFVESRD